MNNRAFRLSSFGSVLSRSAVSGSTLVAIMLAGCATCERHPAACSVAGAVLVGVAVYSITHANGGQHVPPCNYETGVLAQPGERVCH